MSPDEHAELDALRADKEYDDWIANVTDPELHRPAMVFCEGCQRLVPLAHSRAGSHCIDCEMRANNA